MYRYLYQMFSETRDAVNYKCLKDCVLLQETRACCGLLVCQETIKEMYTMLEFPSGTSRRNCRQMAQVQLLKGSTHCTTMKETITSLSITWSCVFNKSEDFNMLTLTHGSMWRCLDLALKPCNWNSRVLQNRYFTELIEPLTDFPIPHSRKDPGDMEFTRWWFYWHPQLTVMVTMRLRASPSLAQRFMIHSILLIPLQDTV